MNRTLLHALIAFCAGSMTVLAFAPFSLSLLAPAGLMVLVLLWRGATPYQAAISGWAYGLGLMGFGVFWLHNSIAQFGGLNLPLAIIITLGFALLMALFYALTGWLAARIPGPVPLVLPAAWGLVEWFRGWFLGGFTWLGLGYSQIDMPLAGFAPLLGAFGVGMLLVLSVALLVQWRAPWVLLVPVIWLSGWWLQQVQWADPLGAAFEASLVQGNIPQQVKWRPDQLQDTLRLYLDLTSEQTDSQLVIWPETAVPAFSRHVESSFLEPLDQRMKQEGRDLLLGIPELQDDGRYYNAMLNLGVSGRSRYYKRHLVPFGEFMPLQFVLQPLIRILDIPMSEFSSGVADQPAVTLAGYQAGITICYEDTFGSETSDPLPHAAFLVNASNDAWFGDSLAPHQHLQMARMRALENSRYLLRATNTGISAIIDEKGGVQGIVPQFEQGVVSTRIVPLQGATLYARFEDWPLVVLILSMLLVAQRVGSSSRTVQRDEGGRPSSP